MRLTPVLTRGIVLLFMQILIGIVVVSLQISLPWSVYEIDKSVKNSDESWHAYFCRQLHVDQYDNSTFLSAAICGDELYILMRKWEQHKTPEQEFRWSTNRHDVLRVNLSNGRAARFAAPDFVHGVISDGSRVYWTTAQFGSASTNANPGRSFLFNGRPTGLKRSMKPKDCFELERLEDCRGSEHNRKLELFALIPEDFHYWDLNIIQQAGETYLLDYEDSGDKIFFRVGLPVGDKDAAEAFAQNLPKAITEYSESQLKENGWICLRNKPRDPWDFNAPSLGEPFGFWIEGAYPCAITYEGEENSEKLQFRWRQFRLGDDVQTEPVPSPIPWSATYREFLSGMGWLHLVISPEDQVYVLSSQHDGRFHVLKWEKKQLRLVAQCGSPLIYASVLEILMYACLMTLWPMCMFGLLVWIFQRFQRPAEYSFGSQTVLLSTGLRRGIARAIDLSVPLSLIACACFADPNAIGWWRETQSKFDYLDWDVKAMLTAPRIWIEFGLPTWFEFYFTLLSVPLCWFPLLLAIVFFIAQTAWQARTGFTFGKWLMGIRVVQTTLRPCGTARSFLREILLLIDSVLLLSWVPGVMVMLATKRRQRLGDLLADTIVVDLRQGAIKANQPDCSG